MRFRSGWVEKNVGLILPLVLLGACVEDKPSTAPDHPQSLPEVSRDFSDGARGGNPHFFFLPPLGPLRQYFGEFDATIRPVIEVCELSGAQCVGGVIAAFAMDSSEASGRSIRVGADQFAATWRTAGTKVTPGGLYRIAVRSPSQYLGFADVAIVRSGSEAERVDRTRYLPVIVGSALPIQFRIEQGSVNAGVATIELDPSLSAGARSRLAAVHSFVHAVSAISGAKLTLHQVDPGSPALVLAVNQLSEPVLATYVFPDSTALLGAAATAIALLRPYLDPILTGQPIPIQWERLVSGHPLFAQLTSDIGGLADAGLSYLTSSQVQAVAAQIASDIAPSGLAQTPVASSPQAPPAFQRAGVLITDELTTDIGLTNTLKYIALMGQILPDGSPVLLPKAGKTILAASDGHLTINVSSNALTGNSAADAANATALASQLIGLGFTISGLVQSPVVTSCQQAAAQKLIQLAPQITGLISIGQLRAAVQAVLNHSLLLSALKSCGPAFFQFVGQQGLAILLRNLSGYLQAVILVYNGWKLYTFMWEFFYYAYLPIESVPLCQYGGVFGCYVLEYISGNGQTGEAGKALISSLIVRVTDDQMPAQPVIGAAVTFYSKGGGGSLSPVNVLTDSQGMAQTIWTLGPVVGTQFAYADAAGATRGAPFAFYANATPPTTCVPKVGARLIAAGGPVHVKFVSSDTRLIDADIHWYWQPTNPTGGNPEALLFLHNNKSGVPGTEVTIDPTRFGYPTFASGQDVWIGMLVNYLTPPDFTRYWPGSSHFRAVALVGDPKYQLRAGWEYDGNGSYGDLVVDIGGVVPPACN